MIVRVVLGNTAAVVIGSFPLGESDRVVTLFARDWARSAGSRKRPGAFAHASAAPSSSARWASSCLFEAAAASWSSRPLRHHPALRAGARAIWSGWAGGVDGRVCSRDSPPNATGKSPCTPCWSGSPARWNGHAGRRRWRSPSACAAWNALGHRPRLDAYVRAGSPIPFPRPALGSAVSIARPAPGRCGRGPISARYDRRLRAARAVSWDEALALPLGRPRPSFTPSWRLRSRASSAIRRGRPSFSERSSGWLRSREA